jgi:hypothetical protein
MATRHAGSIGWYLAWHNTKKSFGDPPNPWYPIFAFVALVSPLDL